jgi:hypothetical protein
MTKIQKCSEEHIAPKVPVVTTSTFSKALLIPCFPNKALYLLRRHHNCLTVFYLLVNLGVAFLQFSYNPFSQKKRNNIINFTQIIGGLL